MRISLIVFIYLAGFHILLGQFRCDTLDKSVFFVTEILPTSNITYNQLEELLENSIDLNEYHLNDGDMIHISFIINCKGEDFDYQVSQYINITLQEKIIQIIQESMDWTPAKQRNREVDFKKIISIRIDNNQFNVLDEKEMKKHNRKNK